ncbi:MAG: molybdenum cofactor guanylyltransferase [Actinobacteria bacterium]|nr:molybdenum cofactor guanylyltransferase [Actinomycetota bacterium]
MTRVAGLLLTGGASRRLGRDKAAVVLDGLSLAEHAAAVLANVCFPCLEVGPGRSPLPAIQEVPPGSGPLAALVAGGHALRVEHGHDGPVLLLACDMPRVTAGLLELIVNADTTDSVVPEGGGRLQPLCARYSPEAMAVAGELVAAGEASMHALLDRVPCRRCSEADWSRVAPADAFSDIDTPGDLEALRGD